jgi:hypothetical protein
MRQKSLIELESAYSKYVQYEFIKNAKLNSQLDTKYYEEREKMWEDKLKKQVRTNVYIFVSMMFLFLLKS